MNYSEEINWNGGKTGLIIIIIVVIITVIILFYFIFIFYCFALGVSSFSNNLNIKWMQVPLGANTSLTKFK